MLAVLALGGMALASLPAEATRAHKAARKTAGNKAHAAARMRAMSGTPTDPDKDAALMIDGATGKVLYARNEAALRHPASLTKMMTLYLLFDALKAGKITLQTPMPVSDHATRQKPTKLFLKRGQTIAVDTAIRAIVIRSANDVAVVISEALGGTEGNFAEMMTQKAREMGMRDTNYHNASGLPNPLQITTANDLAVLARRLAYDYPQFFPYFSLPGFTYQGVYYPTHDNLIGRYNGADGIKTGFTGASGFNLTSSVVRDGVHVIGVVMGGRTALRRDMEMMRLLDDTFTQIRGNPALVGRGTVPWMAVAQAQPAVAGFTLAPSAAPQNQFAALSPVPSQSNSSATPPPVTDSSDEDAAEAHRAPDESFAVIHVEAPKLAAVAQPPAPAPVASVAPALRAAAAAPIIPATRPLPRPVQVADATPVAPSTMPITRPSLSGADTALPAPVAKPAPKPAQVTTLDKPAPKPVADDSDQGVNGRNWTVQIGAYADQALAKAQLSAYAQKSMDVLGKAGELVVPFQVAGGHTMYRARFGLFGERQAREVCDRLTQRGQTCFAAGASR